MLQWRVRGAPGTVHTPDKRQRTFGTKEKSSMKGRGELLSLGKEARMNDLP